MIVITCNMCPVAQEYEQRLIDFTNKYQGKANVVAINVNDYDEDILSKMIERAKENNFNFPYLRDESQQIARALGSQGDSALLRPRQETQPGLSRRDGR